MCETLLNPDGLEVDPNNGMVCIDDVIQSVMDRPEVHKAFPAGFTRLDLTLLGIRQFLMTDKCAWFFVYNFNAKAYQNMVAEKGASHCYEGFMTSRLVHVGAAARFLVQPDSLLPRIQPSAVVGR